MAGQTLRFETREQAMDLALRLISDGLRQAIAERGRADFLTSGGRSPGPLLDRLSREELDWARVTVGLVDERWVPPEHEASNEALARRWLLRNRAGAAGFIPMRTDHASPAEAAADRNLAYGPHCSPPDAVLLGMGGDGHTASWFPRSKGLEAALSPAGGETVAAIDATGCPVAGEHPHRLTLTGPAVTSARIAVMLLFGEEKLGVLETALAADPLDMPVRHAIDGLGDRLTIAWAP